MTPASDLLQIKNTFFRMYNVWTGDEKERKRFMNCGSCYKVADKVKYRKLLGRTLVDSAIDYTTEKLFR